MWVHVDEKGVCRDYTALQAAVKDDLWLCTVQDATVASPDSGKWNVGLMLGE